MTHTIDQPTETAYKREALRLRRVRLDKPAQAVIEYAAKQARREIVDNIMRTNKGVI